jgi:ABC-2 type transport system permease protein
MFKVIKNNILRLKNEKSYLITALVITIVPILLAVYFTSKFQMKGNIALVTNSNKFDMTSKYINVNVMKEAPAKSTLVMEKYDAIVTDKGKGNFDVVTYKGDDFKKFIEGALQGKSSISYTPGGTRKAGTNILGYLTMFVLMEGTLFMRYFSEDKINGAFKRVLISPISIKSYLLAQYIFNFFIIYISTFIVLVVEKELLKVDIGFNYFQYSYLLAILTLIATAFGFFMSAIIENTDDSSMMATLIITLTSMLAGCFYSFTNKNNIIDKITAIMPQKNYLNLVQGIENKSAISNYSGQLAYIFALSIILFIIGAVICNRRYSDGKY